MAITNRRPFVLAIGENSVAHKIITVVLTALVLLLVILMRNLVLFKALNCQKECDLWSEVGRINIFVT